MEYINRKIEEFGAIKQKNIKLMRRFVEKRRKIKAIF